MKNIGYILLLILSLGLATYVLLNKTGDIAEIITAFCGFVAGGSIVLIKLSSKNNVLKSYKRELEKESISSDESAAKVKVLESKIEVLEKALQNALKNK